MLRYPGNRLFVRNVLNYALEDDQELGKRHGKLYIVTGSFPTHGTFGDPASSGGFLDALRHLRDFLRDVDRDGIPPLAAFLLAAAVGLSIVLWISSRAARTHQPIVPRYTRALCARMLSMARANVRAPSCTGMTTLTTGTSSLTRPPPRGAAARRWRR